MIHNFNAGPSHLPSEVLEEASKAIINYQNSGLSILEMGHRTTPVQNMMEEARNLVKELMALDDDHDVLFLHGGATTQFMQIPMNILDQEGTVAIADTGVWSTKAIDEATHFGKVHIACSSREQGYHFIPKEVDIPMYAQYAHYTSNNTIYGTQWKTFPESDIPMVADMSSDIFSRTLDFNSFALLYAGAQKNMGAAGATLVVVDRKVLGKIRRKIPPIMDYLRHIKADSMLNTPPVFAIYLSLLTLKWLKKNGGIAAMEKTAITKAQLLYHTIDESKHFKGAAAKEDRSNMNVCFVTQNEKHEKDFLEFATKNGIYGIKGHRSVGGFRASLYNAVSMDSVIYLTERIKEFDGSR